METSQEEEYFTSYNHAAVHELMLKDRPRTLAYKKFFEENREFVCGKVVMDVGSGTGILAMFAAAAGAKRVYAIEASEMAAVCKHIVVCNGFKDKIEVINKRVEDVDLGEDFKVDMIVSEWMGFYLLHESMLDSVIFARDKFLKPDGLMVPSHANLLLAPVSMERYYDEHFEFWSNCYGFDLSPMMSEAMASTFREPLITEISEKQLMAESDFLVAFDLKTVTLSDVNSVSKSSEYVIKNSGTIHAFAAWFNVVFTCPESDGLPGDNGTQERGNSDTSESERAYGHTADGTNNAGCNGTTTDGKSSDIIIPSGGLPSPSLPITLSTSPYAETTHWKQTVIFLGAALDVEKGARLPCQIQLSQDEDNKRHYNISIDLSCEEDIDEETNDHAVPCDCGASRCLLIKTVMEKFEEEQDKVETEAEDTETNAEIEAARVLDSETVSDISM